MGEDPTEGPAVSATLNGLLELTEYEPRRSAPDDIPVSVGELLLTIRVIAWSMMDFLVSSGNGNRTDHHDRAS